MSEPCLHDCNDLICVIESPWSTRLNILHGIEKRSVRAQLQLIHDILRRSACGKLTWGCLEKRVIRLKSGLWFEPLWKILVNWDDYSKPPTSKSSFSCIFATKVAMHWSQTMHWTPPPEYHTARRLNIHELSYIDVAIIPATQNHLQWFLIVNWTASPTKKHLPNASHLNNWMRHECWSILIPVLYSPLTIKLSLVQYLSSNKDRRLGDRTPQADLSKPKPRQLVVGRVQVDQSARAFQPWKTCRKPSGGLPWVTPPKSPFSKGKIHDSPDSVLGHHPVRFADHV